MVTEKMGSSVVFTKFIVFTELSVGFYVYWVNKVNEGCTVYRVNKVNEGCSVYRVSKVNEGFRDYQVRKVKGVFSAYLVIEGNRRSLFLPSNTMFTKSLVVTKFQATQSD
jgi:hypothetical protein